MLQRRVIAVAVLILATALAWWVFIASEGRPFKLGLDLSGGTHLVFRAAVDALNPSEVDASMDSLRDTIERRVNLFGVAEPIVYTERGSALVGNTDHRLVVELPGVTDTQAAIEQIGKTPVLEFKLQEERVGTGTPQFTATGLTGRYLDSAQLQFGTQQGGLANEPIVSLIFDSEGAALFENITRTYTGRTLGIFLDGALISAPVINEPIAGGRAVITGRFSPEEARLLVRDLNFGALPVPIELVSTETIGSTLGEEAVARGLEAGMWSLGLVALFMIFWYRLPGAVAAVALVMYVLVMLALFKLIPVTLTAAGIAGLILSVGMAVDANVLIFSRMKEELDLGHGTEHSVEEGFSRAWPAIRDGHVTSIISAAILFWFGTSLVQGFALVFGLGVLTSLFTAVVVSRSLLRALALDRRHVAARFLFGNGITF